MPESPLPMTPGLYFILNVELLTAITSGAIYHAPGDANAAKNGPLSLIHISPQTPAIGLQHYWSLRRSRITHLFLVPTSSRHISSPYQQALFYTYHNIGGEFHPSS